MKGSSVGKWLAAPEFCKNSIHSRTDSRGRLSLQKIIKCAAGHIRAMPEAEIPPVYGGIFIS